MTALAQRKEEEEETEENNVEDELQENKVEDQGQEISHLTKEQKADANVENIDSSEKNVGEEEGTTFEVGEKLPSMAYYTIMILMIMIAIIITIAVPNADIHVAQVSNGVLLPAFSFCLLACLNDPHLMGNHPEKSYDNIHLVLSVTFSLSLAGNVVFTRILGLPYSDAMKVSSVTSVVTMIISCLIPLPSVSDSPSIPLWQPLLESLNRC